MFLYQLLALMSISALTTSDERDWILITTDEDLNMHFVDKESIEIVSYNIKSAWLRYEYHTPPPHQPNLKSIEALENFDCSNRRRQIVLILASLEGGEVVVEDTVRPWRNVSEGSSSELEVNFICSSR